MTPSEDEAFTAFLLQKAAEAEALGYNPKQFKAMLGAQGGVATTRQLLSKNTPTEGFTRLWELGRLDLTLEALIVETPWREHFDPQLLQLAEKRLLKYEYRYTPFEVSAPVPLAPNVPPAEAPATRGRGRRRPPVPERPRNMRSFSAFCEYLGAPLANPADRWCGYNPERGIAVFTLWADGLVDDTYLLWDASVRAGDTRIGARELQRVIESAIAAGHAVYGIRCEHHQVTPERRERAYFDEDQVLVLRFERRGENVVARILGAVPAVDVAEGRRGEIRRFESAMDDLGVPPPGNAAPERTYGGIATGYRRDDAVRDYVIRRAGGRCEYCGTTGFELANGQHYVEAHHVIALSAQGPDTVENVIALCPTHHREAHYGGRADELEERFLVLLKTLAKA